MSGKKNWSGNLRNAREFQSGLEKNEMWTITYVKKIYVSKKYFVLKKYLMVSWYC